MVLLLLLFLVRFLLLAMVVTVVPVFTLTLLFVHKLCPCFNDELKRLRLRLADTACPISPSLPVSCSQDLLQGNRGDAMLEVNGPNPLAKQRQTKHELAGRSAH